MSTDWRTSQYEPTRNLATASFRGVEFWWDLDRFQGGRRLTVHGFPTRDTVEIEDLGDGPRRLMIEAFVLGRDYVNQRDALIAALDARGSGLLVHPHYGRVQVCVESYEVEHSTKLGGLASFRLQMVRDDGVTDSGEQVDHRALSDAHADAAAAAAAELFGEQYVVPDSFARETATAKLVDVMTDLGRYVDGAWSAGDGQLQLLQAALGDPLDSARSLLQRTVDLPAATAYQLQTMIGAIRHRASLRALFDRYQRSQSPAETPQAAIDDLVVSTLGVQLGRLTSADDYASYDEAVRALVQLTDVLDAVVASANDALYDTVQQMRTGVLADVTERAASLARITHVTPRATLPALVLAHQLYGAAGVERRADDLVARNRVRHPGFVVGGRQIEALTP